MTPLNPRILPGLAITIALTAALAAGCGASDDTAGPGETSPSLAPPSDSSSPTPAPTRTPGPAVPAPTPTPAETEPPEGSGDGEDDDKPATAGGGICSDLESEDVGKALGGTVRGAGLPPGGCEFTQRDRAAASATFLETSFKKTPGGMSGAKSNATASVEGEPQDLAGVGDAAFVVTGTVFGGDQIQGAGAVRVGDRLIQVTLSQRAGLSPSKVRALVVNLLELAADEAD